MQAEQKAAGLVARRDDDESGPILAAPSPVAERAPSKEIVNESLSPTVPERRSISLAGARSPGNRGQGFTRLLPPTVSTAAALTQEWVVENWTEPSPWCRVEGLPDHPEFQNNLLAFQNAL